MEKQFAPFTPMSRELLLETNGGGFAYDAGKFLRLLGCYIAGGTDSVAAEEAAIWAINEASNS